VDGGVLVAGQPPGAVLRAQDQMYVVSFGDQAPAKIGAYEAARPRDQNALRQLRKPAVVQRVQIEGCVRPHF
jgi:hypothetical protein